MVFISYRRLQSRNRNELIQRPSLNSTTSYYVDATENGCTTGSRTEVVATINPIPTITSTTPASRCLAGTVTLSATPSAGEVNWYTTATGGTSLHSGNSYSPNLSSTTTYYVDATANGCTTGTRTAIIATVNPIPTITSYTPGSRCGSGTIELKATASTGTVHWFTSANSTNSVATGNSFFASPPSASNNSVTSITYYVEAILDGCTNSERIAVTAKRFGGNPPANISNNSISGPSSVCPPVSSITYTVTPVDRAETYVWSLPQGFEIVSGEGTNTITVQVTNSAIVGNNQTISVYAKNPCGNGGGRDFSVSINSFADVDAGDNFALCLGDSSNLTNNLLGNASSISQWEIVSRPTGTSGTGEITGGPWNSSTQIPFVFTPTSPGTYTLRTSTNTATGSCPEDKRTGEDEVTITVHEQSVAPNSVSSSISTICNGDSAILTQTGGSLGTGASWKWYSDASFNDLVGTSTDADASLSVNPNSTTTYYLRAESTSGAPCTANVPATTSVEVIVNDPSVAPASLNTNDSTICKGESTTLTQTGGSLGTGASWNWYSDAAFTNLIGTSTDADASLSVNPTATTTYYLRAESTSGAPCTANVPATTSVEVIVNDPSVAPASLNTNDSTICKGESTTLTQTGGSLGTGASWKWYSDASFTDQLSRRPTLMPMPVYR